MAQQDFVEEGALEVLPDSMNLDGIRLEELLMEHLHIIQTCKCIRLGRAHHHRVAGRRKQVGVSGRITTSLDFPVSEKT
jgi:hypothetical protein